MFDQFSEAFDLLGIDGTSSDETDDEGFTEGMIKQVRRINLPWLHGDIAGMKRSLETLDAPRMSAKCKVGNQSCFRLAAATKNDTSRRAARGLPSNWYNPSWIQKLTDLEKALLEPSPERPIPELVNLFIQSITTG